MGDICSTVRGSCVPGWISGAGLFFMSARTLYHCFGISSSVRKILFALSAIVGSFHLGGKMLACRKAWCSYLLSVAIKKSRVKRHRTEYTAVPPVLTAGFYEVGSPLWFTFQQTCSADNGRVPVGPFPARPSSDPFSDTSGPQSHHLRLSRSSVFPGYYFRVIRFNNDKYTACRQYLSICFAVSDALLGFFERFYHAVAPGVKLRIRNLALLRMV